MCLGTDQCTREPSALSSRSSLCARREDAWPNTIRIVPLFVREAVRLYQNKRFGVRRRRRCLVGGPLRTSGVCIARRDERLDPETLLIERHRGRQMLRYPQKPRVSSCSHLHPRGVSIGLGRFIECVLCSPGELEPIMRADMLSGRVPVVLAHHATLHQ